MLDKIKNEIVKAFLLTETLSTRSHLDADILTPLMPCISDGRQNLPCVTFCRQSTPLFLQTLRA